MKTIPLQKYDIIDRQQMLQNIADNKGVASFEIWHDWYNVNTGHLNETVSEVVEDGYLLMNLEYSLVRIADDGNSLVFRVTSNMTDEYVENDEVDQ